MDKILIKGILLNQETRDVLIEKGRIAKISGHIELPAAEASGCRVLQGGGKALIPGFINMHTHSGMTLMRGFSEDAALQTWLADIWRIEPRLDAELLYWGTKLACLEMLKTGTTCFLDQYWQIDTTVQAVREMGLRSFQAHVALNQNDRSKEPAVKEEFQRIYEASLKWGDLNHFCVGIHAPYTVSDTLAVWCSDFARRHGLKVHVHLSETQKEIEDSKALHGCSPFGHYERLGILGPEVMAAHSLWLDEHDMDLIAKYDVKPIHNINSNLKLASGYRFLFNEMKERGITMCLGTDGCGSSNNLDMRETMKTAALVQKAWRKDPTALPLQDLMDMATLNGAKALGIDAGEIAEGRLADLVIVDIDNYAFTPNINFLSNLVYSANSSCVETVIINGRIVMENREVPGEREILDQVRRLYKKLYV